MRERSHFHLRSIALLTAGLLAGCNRPEPSAPSPGAQSAAVEPDKPAATPESPAAAPAPAGAKPAVVPVSVSNSRPSALPTAPASGGLRDVTFDDIKLELKKGEPYDPSFLTTKVKELDGQTIRIRGYILPSFQQSGIKAFVLVRDNQECCFGPGALLHDCVLVEMVPPASTTFTTRPVGVKGTFSIREVKGPDGKHLAIYHLDGTEVN